MGLSGSLIRRTCVEFIEVTKFCLVSACVTLSDSSRHTLHSSRTMDGAVYEKIPITYVLLNVSSDGTFSCFCWQLLNRQLQLIAPSRHVTLITPISVQCSHNLRVLSLNCRGPAFSSPAFSTFWPSGIIGPPFYGPAFSVHPRIHALLHWLTDWLTYLHSWFGAYKTGKISETVGLKIELKLL